MTGRSRSRTGSVARRALTGYRRMPLSTRAHVRLRWWSAPFAAVEAWLPPAGNVLEIGCGHGVFSRYAAATAAERAVLGTDIDEAKVGVAQRAATAAGVSVRFTVATPGHVAPGPWVAIVIIDVLYLLSGEEQRDLLSSAATQLAPGGVLLVKEMARTPRWKARWNRAQETLAVRAFRITEGSHLNFTPIEQVCRWLAEAGLAPVVHRLDRGYPHPHVLIVARRPLPDGEFGTSGAGPE